MESLNVENTTASTRLCRRVRTYATGLLVALAFVLMAVHVLLMGLDERIRSHIEGVLTRANPHLVVEVRGARRVNSKVIEVRGSGPSRSERC